MRKATIKNSLRWLGEHSWQLLIAAVLVGLVLRLGFVLAFPQIGRIEGMDAFEYHRIAVNLLDGRGYSQDGTHPTIFVAPGYPIFLAGIYAVFGQDPYRAKAVQTFLGALLILIAYGFAREVLPRWGAVLVAWIVAVFPDLVVISNYLYTENLFVPLFLLSLWLTHRAWRKQSLALAGLAGLTFALATLTRGTSMLLPVLFAGLYLLLDRFRWRTVALSAVLVAVFVAGMVPWTLRNKREFGAFIPVAVGTGDVLFTGNYLPFDGEYRYEATRALIDSLTLGMPLVERDQVLRKAALTSIKAHPAATAWLTFRKFFRFWLRIYENVPSGKPRQTNWLISLPLALSYYPLLLLSLVGVWAVRIGWRQWADVLLTLLYFGGIHAVLLPIPRYRMPIIPLMAMLAVAAVWYWLADGRRDVEVRKAEAEEVTA